MVMQFLIWALIGAPAPAAVPQTDPAAAAAEPSDAPADAVGETPTPKTRPTVNLVADEAMTEWLVIRLLEDGYPLVAYPAAAHVELTVVSSPEGNWTVTAKGQSTVSFEIEPAADPAVTQLEVLHRSFDALEDVEPGAPVRPQPAAVSLSVTESSPPTLAPQMALGVLAAGARLVPPGQAAEFQVCATQEAEASPQMSLVEADAECDPAAAAGTAAPVGAVVSRSAAIVAVAMAGALDAEPPPTQEVPEPAPPPAPEPATDSERAPGLEPTPRRGITPLVGAPLVVRGGVSAGLIGRVEFVDALLTASMTIGREPGIQGWLEVQVRPVSVVDPLKIVETFPAAGLKFRVVTIRRFSFDIGALIGPEIHTYVLQDSRVQTGGNDVGASAESVLGFAFKVWKEHEIQCLLRVGTGKERVHRFDDQVLWQRNNLRVGATLGMAFGRKLRS